MEKNILEFHLLFKPFCNRISESDNFCNFGDNTDTDMPTRIEQFELATKYFLNRVLFNKSYMEEI